MDTKYKILAIVCYGYQQQQTVFSLTAKILRLFREICLDFIVASLTFCIIY